MAPRQGRKERFGPVELFCPGWWLLLLGAAVCPSQVPLAALKGDNSFVTSGHVLAISVLTLEP